MTDQEWKESELKKFIAFQERARTEFIEKHNGSDQHTWERWDCGCSWGCDACGYTTHCTICRAIGNGGKIVWNHQKNPPLTYAERALRSKTLKKKFGASMKTRTLSHQDRTIEILNSNDVVIGVAKRMKKRYWKILSHGN